MKTITNIPGVGLQVLTGSRLRSLDVPVESGCQSRETAKAILYDIYGDHHEAERLASAFAREFCMGRMGSRWEVTEDGVRCWAAARREAEAVCAATDPAAPQHGRGALR